MKNVVEAVKYGIETLNVSPDEMFALIESSQGYSGEDYGRWLANEIIKIAEREGMGYSQLLVKKFAIISTILEGIDVSIKSEWVDLFKSKLNSDINISVNFPELAEELDIEWFNGIDMMGSKEFSDNHLSTCETLYNALTGDEKVPFTISAKLESVPAKKNIDLFINAKGIGLPLRTEGALIMYRMCNLVESWDLGEEFKFIFFTTTDFLSSKDNEEIMYYFLCYFNYSGIVIDSTELLDGTCMKNEYIFCICTPRVSGEIKDGFLFHKVVLKDNKLIPITKKLRYSRSTEFMVLDIKNSVNPKDKVLGFLHRPMYGNLDYSVSYLPYIPTDKSKESIPITESNFRDIVVFYAVEQSLSSGGISSGIKTIINGTATYEQLFYNCLPLFLFSTNTCFNYSGLDTDVFNVSKEGSFIQKFLEDGELHFSFEAKQLLTVCKGFLDYLGEDCKDLTFEDVRKESDCADLNRAYTSALVDIKDYIRCLYKKIE